MRFHRRYASSGEPVVALSRTISIYSTTCVMYEVPKTNSIRYGCDPAGFTIINSNILETIMQNNEGWSDKRKKTVKTKTAVLCRG